MPDGTRYHVCIVLEAHAYAQMGGAEYQAHQLAEKLCQYPGVRVTYLARSVPSHLTTQYEVRQVGNSDGFRRRALLFDARKLWRTLSQISPDVIYQRAKHSYTAVCALYAQRAGIPMIFHVASEPDADGRWFRKRLSVNTPLDLMEVAAGNFGVRRAPHVVVQSNDQGDLLRKRFHRVPTALIRNFQPLPDALPAKPAGGLRLLWVGNIKEVKRPERFLELAERMAARPGFEFWMVGRESQHRGMLPVMTAVRRSNHVRYFGELPLKEVNALMDAADVFVNTSSFEGFPNTFIQAWARGAIVTTLDVDVDGGLDARGIGFRAGSISRLTEVIDRLALSPHLRAEVSRKAFAHVWKEHSLKNLTELARFVLEAKSARE